jgi:hypothetical protein
MYRRNCLEGLFLLTVKSEANYRSECLPLLVTTTRDGTDHTCHYLYGLLFFFILLPNIFFVTNRIAAVRSHSERSFVSVCKMLTVFSILPQTWPVFHACARNSILLDIRKNGG